VAFLYLLPGHSPKKFVLTLVAALYWSQSFPVKNAALYLIDVAVSDLGFCCLPEAFLHEFLA
jgi:hypothetical protein